MDFYSSFYLKFVSHTANAEISQHVMETWLSSNLIVIV